MHNVIFSLRVLGHTAIRHGGLNERSTDLGRAQGTIHLRDSTTVRHEIVADNEPCRVGRPQS